MSDLSRSEILLSGSDIGTPLSRTEAILKKVLNGEEYTGPKLSRIEVLLSELNVGGKLGTKTVTDNGTYNASSDNLDGYSAVTVAIPSASGVSF